MKAWADPVFAAKLPQRGGNCKGRPSSKNTDLEIKQFRLKRDVDFRHF